MSHHLSQGGVATSDAMHARHVTNPREASPDESEHDTWTSHGSMGPSERLNRLKNTCTQGSDLRTHKTATWRKHTPSGAHRGSADPTGRPNRPCGRHSGASMWWLLVGPSLHLGGVCIQSTPVLRPINRRGASHSLPTHLTTPLSLLFLRLGGRLE
jgi:hypothetical protein